MSSKKITIKVKARQALKLLQFLEDIKPVYEIESIEDNLTEEEKLGESRSDILRYQKKIRKMAQKELNSGGFTLNLNKKQQSIASKFDDFCKFLDWENKTNPRENFNRIKSIYNDSELAEFEDFAYFLVGELEKAIILYERQNNTELYLGSDDNCHDLLSEIVSKGVQNVRNFIKNPQKLLKKYEQEEYTENFFYNFEKPIPINKSQK